MKSDDGNVSQQQIECDVVRKFAPHFTKAIVPETIQSLEEKDLRDVLCQCIDGSFVAFQLTEVIDQRLRHVEGKQVLIQTELDRIIQDSDHPLRIQYPSHWFHIGFQGNKTDQALLRWLPILISYLIEKRLEVGRHKPTDRKIASFIKFIDVNPNLILGTRFEVYSGCSIGDPLLDRITSKFDDSRSYRGNEPLHLLIYYREQPRSLIGIWENGVQYIETSLHTTKLQAVWIYSYLEDRVIYQYATSDAARGGVPEQALTAPSSHGVRRGAPPRELRMLKVCGPPAGERRPEPVKMRMSRGTWLCQTIDYVR